ncbi:DUF4382 domain-containing protein [Halolamina sediminis]|uniref:DUF4382 domain-containing protein n=1 Tax=Halolamina sediminis TaxID=1480675 RepID=UPI0006B4D0BC|nr:DUF4382 domain-containing protein [Halolamina sediminis]
MQRQTVATVLAAAMLLVAGCGSGVAPGGSDGSGEGTVNMYISDQNNAIDDFEHLNVTITEIAAHRVDDSESETEASETAVSETEEIDAEDDGWVTRDVDNVTVDLTELQGNNATMVGQIDAPNGTYDKVFVHVSDVNGTLTDGSSTDVKLPSSKLHLNEEFTVGDGEAIDFVFDITVVKRGQSGSYNIQPVASESGPDQEIEERPAAKQGEREESDEDEEAETETPATGTPTATAQTSASLDFYVSDERNAISNFEHLNVTIEKVGVHRADDGGENESAWVEKDVNNVTVDLTELQGANASKLGTLAVQNGTYDKTFVHVAEINGTLTNGESTNVKLPSEKLQLKKEFTVGDGEAIDFVFDITVFEAGNSGKYILKPVVGESGTGDQVEIEERDDRSEAAEANEADDDEAEQPLELSLDGNATAGENVTVTVTQNGSAVAGAAVTANGDEVGETGENGTVVVAVPADAEELELEAERDEAEGELEVAVEQSGDDGTPTENGTESSDLAAPVF